ncbi:MAG TPA: hypothetical protein VKE73_07365 [Myxococcota bacterium]|nr:hypothetical protein [Myxococcota bacterium]
MIRLACVLVLIAMACTLLVVLRTDGMTATALMFVGAPSLVLGLGFWGFAQRRAAGRSDAGKPA